MTEHHPSRADTERPHDYLPAAGRDAFLPFYDPFTAILGVGSMHRRLIGQAGLAAGQQVLEIGCGTGNLTIRAKRTQPGADLLGLDPDPLALARARSKVRGRTGIRFEHGYSQRLPYADGSFDRVLSALMFHHLDQDAKVATVAEVARVLRPGGSLHLADVVGHAHGVHGFLARRMAKAGHLAHDGEDGIPALFTAAGLELGGVVERRYPVVGLVTFFRATRPA